MKRHGGLRPPALGSSVLARQRLSVATKLLEGRAGTCGRSLSNPDRSANRANLSEAVSEAAVNFFRQANYIRL